MYPMALPTQANAEIEDQVASQHLSNWSVPSGRRMRWPVVECTHARDGLDSSSASHCYWSVEDRRGKINCVVRVYRRRFFAFGNLEGLGMV